MTRLELAAWLVNKPTGAPLAYLIVAAVVAAVAAVVAGWAQDLYRGLIAVAVLAIALALLT